MATLEAVVGVFDRHIEGQPQGSFILRRELYKLQRVLGSVRPYFDQRKVNTIAQECTQDRANELWDMFAGLQVGCQGFLIGIGRKYKDLSEDEMTVILNDIDAHCGGGEILDPRFDGVRKELYKRLPDLER